MASKTYPPCPKCNLKLEPRNGKFGFYMACPNYPETCDTTGARSKHDGVIRISDQRTRNMRKAAHSLFDQIWQGRYLTRSEAYRWLACAMHLHGSKCHIQHFSVEECQQVIDSAKELLSHFEKEPSNGEDYGSQGE